LDKASHAHQLTPQIFAIITSINEHGTTALFRAECRAGAAEWRLPVHPREREHRARQGWEELAHDDSVKAAYLGGDV
jgi:hypothetical protein